MEIILLLETRASLRSLLRYGLEEVTTLSFPGRVSFRLKGFLREYASEHCNMAICLIEKVFFLTPMYPGAFEKPIDGTYKIS